MKKEKTKEDKPEKPNKEITLADLVFELESKRISDKKEVKVKEKISENGVSENKKISADIKSSILSNIFSNFRVAEKSEDSAEPAQFSNLPAEREDDSGQGGYGAVKKQAAYGSGASAAYANYEKLFSHFGIFRAAGSYPEDSGSSGGAHGNKEGSFFLLDRQVMDDSIKSIKYRNSMMGESPLPTGGVSSADWELFKIWKVVDPVMYNLKMRTV